MIRRVVLNVMVVGLLRELLDLRVKSDKNRLPVRPRGTILAYIHQESTVLAFTDLPFVVTVCNSVPSGVVPIHVDLV